MKSSDVAPVLARSAKFSWESWNSQEGVIWVLGPKIRHNLSLICRYIASFTWISDRMLADLLRTRASANPRLGFLLIVSDLKGHKLEGTIHFAVFWTLSSSLSLSSLLNDWVSSGRISESWFRFDAVTYVEVFHVMDKSFRAWNSHHTRERAFCPTPKTNQDGCTRRTVLTCPAAA
jgi:hypothetical protein